MTLETDGNVNGDIIVLANPFLMDFDRSLTVNYQGKELTVELEAKKDVITSSVNETGDPFLSWADEITVSLQ